MSPPAECCARKQSIRQLLYFTCWSGGFCANQNHRLSSLRQGANAGGCDSAPSLTDPQALQLLGHWAAWRVNGSQEGQSRCCLRGRREEGLPATQT